MSNLTSSGSAANPNVVLGPDHLYGYIPTMWVCITFVTLFSITTVIHIGQAVLIKPRLWWLIPTTAMCGTGEILGWSARLWSSINPLNRNGFLMQIATTIIAPVFLTAAMYTILGLLIEAVGPKYSRLQPKTYLKVFVTADVTALIVQAAGGALASGANSTSQSNNASHIMLTGIFFQLFTMIAYTLLAIEFLVRFYLQKPFAGRPSSQDVSSSEDSPENEKSRKAKLPQHLTLMVLGLALATLFVFIRTGYRTVELLGGWHGHIIRTQIFFNILDATPIVLALFTLNIFSPAYLLRAESPIYDYA